MSRCCCGHVDGLAVFDWKRFGPNNDDDSGGGGLVLFVFCPGADVVGPDPNRECNKGDMSGKPLGLAPGEGMGVIPESICCIIRAIGSSLFCDGELFNEDGV